MVKTLSFLPMPPGLVVKPVPFVAALVPALAVLVFVATLRHGLAWYEAAALFYGGLALAEFGYLGSLFVRRGEGLRTAQEPTARMGGAE